MNRRALLAVAVLLLWVTGLGFLVRREYFRPDYERLAEAGMRVTPGAVFYGVMQDGKQIGFASSTVDTTLATTNIRDYLVANVAVGGTLHRAIARTDVVLTRGLRMREFRFTLEGAAQPLRASGVVHGDTLLVLAVATGTQPADTQRIALQGPILLPTVLPLAVALGERPKVGGSYSLPVFDPVRMEQRQVAVAIRAESLFVVADSALADTSGGWIIAQQDTVKGWQLGTDEGGGFSGWVDEQGRVLSTWQLGFELRRMPYEMAFAGWREADARSGEVEATRDILESTAIAANKSFSREIPTLRVRVSGVSPGGFDLDGGRQRLAGDTLTITREGDAALAAPWRLPVEGRRLHRRYTEPEPLLQSTHRDIRETAQRIVGAERDPRVAAERILRWVNDSLQQRISIGVPDALAVLRSRVGDCNEHTQLYVALARSVGIPARIAAGLAYIDGKFYYHAWPEVFLNGWVAVDPTFGQFPADAAHLRFVTGGLARQAELLRLMGNLDLHVLSDAGGRR